MAGGSAGASASGPALEFAALLLNITLGAFDAGLFDEAAAAERRSPAARPRSRRSPTEMAPGSVDLLIVAGVNPVYDAPASLKFAEAMAKVPFVVSLNDRLDETSLLADVLAAGQPPVRVLGRRQRCRRASSPFSSPSSSRCSTRAACSTCSSSGAPQRATRPRWRP